MARDHSKNNKNNNYYCYIIRQIILYEQRSIQRQLVEHKNVNNCMELFI